MRNQDLRHQTKVEGMTVARGAEIIGLTNSGNLTAPFLDRPP